MAVTMSLSLMFMIGIVAWRCYMMTKHPEAYAKIREAEHERMKGFGKAAVPIAMKIVERMLKK